MEDLRIAFAGASGTGKTTLAKYVSETRGLPICPIGSRSVAESMGLASPYDVDRLGKRAEFQRRLLADKVAWEASQESFVTDRTVADNLAYHALHDVRSVSSDDLAAMLSGMQRYTHVFFCPVFAHIDLAGDPARVGERAYHEVYDALLDGLFFAQGLVYDVLIERSIVRRRGNITYLTNGDLAVRKSRVDMLIRLGPGFLRND
jgi:predicted ATPase